MITECSISACTVLLIKEIVGFVQNASSKISKFAYQHVLG